jgi:hypothetical protein
MGINKSISSAPLAVFRMIFGAMMLLSTIRFWALGWIEDHYIQSKVQFKYYGFEWVQLLSPSGMYLLHILMIISALGIMLGALYRLSAIVFFAAFTYTELIDLTYYLNHYYFVSLVSLLLIFVPANCRCSIDVLLWPKIHSRYVPRWTILIFQLQIAIVYTYAGLFKINYDWLIEALPMRIWLPAHDNMPLLGWFFTLKWVPWAFSWIGMLYDCTIVWWLSWERTRVWAYISVVLFHVLTGLLFQIGVFPLVMIGATWIFFSERFHERIIDKIEKRLKLDNCVSSTNVAHSSNQFLMIVLCVFLLFQIIFPWRYLLYPGNVFWTEEGYRFSWRVMLMEKAGTATFYVKDSLTGREGVVNNGDFLCAHQEKQMSMQPDMILQFAHFLKEYYQKMGLNDPTVRAEVYITLNARPSQLLIDPNVDLTKIQDGWWYKDYIIPLHLPK